jgi:hypothetical protein
VETGLISFGCAVCLFSTCVVQLGSRETTAELGLSEFGFVDAARGGTVATYSRWRSHGLGKVGIVATGYGGAC